MAISDNKAKKAPIKNTKVCEYIQRKPRTTGTKIAAMWLIVKDTPAELAISFGLDIF